MNITEYINLKLLPCILILSVLQIEVYCQPGSGFALNFNGTSNNIFFDDILSDLELPFSVSFWTKLESGGAQFNSVIASHYSKEGFYSGFWVTASLEKVTLAYGDGRGALLPIYRRSIGYDFTENVRSKWIHITFNVRGPTDMDIYLNGQKMKGTYSGSGLFEMAKSNNSVTSLGLVTNNLGDNLFKGSLDEIRVWNYSRSEAEIRNDMCRKLSGDESGLVAYWNFDAGSGSVLKMDNVDNLEISAAIQGTPIWQISGAALGDLSFYDYSFSGIKDTVLIIFGDTYFNLSAIDKSAWIGYQFYIVNEPPNSIAGSNFTFEDGYLGLYPIFANGKSITSTITLTSECAYGDFRNGNDDLSWEPIRKTGELPSFSSNYNTEFILDLSAEGLGGLSDSLICPGETLILDIFSNCVDSYLWSTGSDSSSAMIDSEGTYWVERTIRNDVYKSDFEVFYADVIDDFFQKDHIELCPSFFPFNLQLNSSKSYDLVVNESEGLTNGIITDPGIYWVDFYNNCGLTRDTINVAQDDGIPFDLIAEEKLVLCQYEFPYKVELSALNDNVKILATSEDWLDGAVKNAGIHWIRYEHGCYIGEDTIEVISRKISVDRIANVFTPNNDGFNDRFEIDTLLLGSTLEIFDRTGSKLKEFINYQNTWDGQGFEAGTYFYLISESCSNTKIKGWVQIVK